MGPEHETSEALVETSYLLNCLCNVVLKFILDGGCTHNRHALFHIFSNGGKGSISVTDCI